MKTITVIARQFGLSRSTLLYYDRIGLLSPTYRTTGEARLYSQREEALLGRIVTFRRAGIPLETIKAMLAEVPKGVNTKLERRLDEIQREIGQLQAQQKFIVGMLKDAVLRGEKPVRTKGDWVRLLRVCNFTDDDMGRWHVEMERDDPTGHAHFLRRIGIGPSEISRIRSRATMQRMVSNGAQPAGCV